MDNEVFTLPGLVQVNISPGVRLQFDTKSIVENMSASDFEVFRNWLNGAEAKRRNKIKVKENKAWIDSR